MLVLLGLMTVGMVLETLGIGLIVPAIALLTQADGASGSSDLLSAFEKARGFSRTELVSAGMLALLLFYLVRTLYLGFLVWQQMRFAYSVQAQLSTRLFHTYLSQPYTFHLQRNSAQLISHAVTEVNQYAFYGLIPGMLLVSEGLVILGVAALLFVVEPIAATTVVLVFGTCAWAFHRALQGRLTRWGKSRQLHEGMRIQQLQQGLGGIKDAKLLGREHYFLTRYRVHNEQAARLYGYHQTLQNLPRLWLEFLAVLSLVTLVLTMIVQGRDVASILPSIGLFAAAALRLMPSMNRVIGALQSLRYVAAVVDTLYDEMKLRSGGLPQKRPAQPAYGGSLTRISLCDVTYTYPAAPQPAVQSVLLDIPSGQTFGIIGSSGSGKSTLIDLILGLLTPTNGRILVDGGDIQNDLTTWQNQIGYVSQSIFLTDDTVRRNIAFGLPDDQIDEAALAKAIKDAQLEEFVSTLPEGLNTMVGERGVRLSGGQRQRIGIARALYKDPPVLVLDEATSALDNTTEADFMRAIDSLHGRKTVIMVAHRLSTVENCDAIVVMHQGAIVSIGTYAQLISSSPHFQALARQTA